jgi:hypothetical protein
MEAKSLGQIAYDAYGEQQGWVTFAGAQMVSWQSQRPNIQVAWEGVARAVLLAARQAQRQEEMCAIKTTTGHAQENEDSWVKEE